MPKKSNPAATTGDAEIDALIESQEFDPADNDPTKMDPDFAEERVPVPEPVAAPMTPAASADTIAIAAAVGKAIAAELGAGLRGLTEEIANSSHVRQVPLARATIKSAFNPTGDRNRKGLTANWFQNGFKLDRNKLTDEEIALLNQVPNGVFCDSRIEITERKMGGETFRQINWSNSTTQQRTDLLVEVGRTLPEILRKVLADAESQAVGAGARR